MKRFLISLFVCSLVLVVGAARGQEKPKYGGTLNFGLERDISTMNPFVRASGVDLDVRGLIYQPLLDKDLQGNIVPNLAESWSVSKDGLVYTFKLRREVKFHNGQEVTAEDVKWSADYAMEPKNGSEGLSFLRDVKSVRIVDRHTIEFTLHGPRAVFLSYLTVLRPFPVVPRGSVPSGMEKIEGFPPGTGPFSFKEARGLGQVVLVRHKDYWQKGLPYLDQVVFKTSEDPTVRFTSLRAGDLDLIERTPYAFVRKVETGEVRNIKATAAPFAGFRRLIFNVADAPFNNAKLRQAVAYAVDRKQYLQGAFWGYGISTQLRFPQGSPWYVKLPERERDPAKVKTLLTEAGMGGDLEIEFLVRRGTEEEYQVILQQLTTAGLRVKVSPMEGASFRERQRRGAYQVGLFGGDLPNDPADSYPPEYACDEEAVKAKKRTRNWPGYCNQEFDRLLADAGKITDQKKRYEIYARATRILFEDLPDIPLAYVPRFFTYHEKVKGFGADADGRFSGTTFGVPRVWIDK